MFMNRHRAAWVGLLAAAIAIVFLLWTAVVTPRLQEVSAVREQTEQLRQQNTEVEKTIEKLNIASGTITLQTTRLNQLRRQIPNVYDQQALINSLNQSAKDTGITLSSVTFETATDAVLPQAVSGAISNRLVQVPLTVNAQGSYDKLRSFVAKVQDMERVVVPSSLTYSLGTASTGADQATTDSLSMTCNTYSLVDSTSIAGSTGTGSTGTGSTTGSTATGSTGTSD